MKFDLDDLKCLVVGGSSGIGLASAQALVAEGADVMIVGRSADRLAAARETCGQGPGALETLSLDITASSAAAELLNGAEERLGGVNALVYSAGVSRALPLEELTDEEWWVQWELNVMAPKRLLDVIAPVMAKGGGGSVVNVCSSSGRRPSSTNAAYAVTKRAQLALCEVYAQRFGPSGVRVNAVAPGPTATPMWLAPGGLLDETGSRAGASREESLERFGANLPLGRAADPSEIASVIVALVGGRLSASGATLSVDGGHVPEVFP